MPRHDIVVVGTSAGGVEALTKLVETLPAHWPATLCVVLHLPAESPSLLPRILARAGSLPALHPKDGEPIQQGHIYIAPPDHHLLLEPGYMRVVRGPKENRHRPAVDPLFRSAARAYGDRVVGVILTGMLDDGTAGLLAIKRRNGLAIIQDPQEALYPGMPQSAQDHVHIDYCLPLSRIGPLLVQLAQEERKTPEHGEVSEDLQEEVTIAEMETNPLQISEQIGKPSVFSCPECGGVLWEIQDRDFLRFRCRTGHAFSAESVLEEQTELVEKALWTALRALEEKVSLSRRLARQAEARGNPWLLERLRSQLQEAEEDAQLLRQLLLHPPLPNPAKSVTEENISQD